METLNKTALNIMPALTVKADTASGACSTKRSDYLFPLKFMCFYVTVKWQMIVFPFLSDRKILIKF